MVGGIPFELKGRSDYGTDVDQVVYSDESGRVVFSNIEKGSYKLYEPENKPTDPDYIRSNVTYDVRVDPEGHYTITSPDSTFEALQELNGTISVYNEPYHSFTLQKEGTVKVEGDALPVAGASYRLWGNSDYGTPVDKTQTTQSNGRTIFTQLEAGTYHLKETSAPEGYELDPVDYLVEITPEDEITITGNGRLVSRNNMGHYVFVDQENGTVVITKKWKDNAESRAQRLADGLEAVIHISTEPKKSEAYFYGRIVDSWANATPLARLTNNASAIKAFRPFVGRDEYVHELIENNTAKRIDDETTDYVIYAWLDNGTVYWWSDAKNVYLKNDTRFLFRASTNCEVIDMSGINWTPIGTESIPFTGQLNGNGHTIKNL